MESKKPPDKFSISLGHLSEAIKFYHETSSERHLRFLALSKAFEVAVEYAWKELKLKVEVEGIETLSPKDAVRQAAKLKIINSAEDWLDFINTRNGSVHDYFGISEKDYVKIAENFLLQAKALKGD